MTHYCSLCFDAIALPGLCESCESYLAQSPDECPAGGSHTFKWMVSELDTGGSPAGIYCSECCVPAPDLGTESCGNAALDLMADVAEAGLARLLQTGEYVLPNPEVDRWHCQ